MTAAPPTPGAAVRRACERLAERLPSSLGAGLARRKTAPATPLLAAWGSPPAILRCGVPVDPSYRAGDQLFEVDAGGATTRWYANKRGKVVTWSTPLATVHVELLVPSKYPGAGLLSRLTPAVADLRVL